MFILTFALCELFGLSIVILMGYCWGQRSRRRRVVDMVAAEKQLSVEPDWDSLPKEAINDLESGELLGYVAHSTLSGAYKLYNAAGESTLEPESNFHEPSWNGPDTLPYRDSSRELRWEAHSPVWDEEDQ